MPQKTFTVKFHQTKEGDYVEINARAHPFIEHAFIGSDNVTCAVFNWLRKILPDNRTTKAKVTISFEE